MFTVVIEDRLRFSVDDKPNIDGVLHRDGIVQGSTELSFVTVRALDDTNTSILDESIATQTAVSFNITFDLSIAERSYGSLFVSVFPKDTSVTATLNGAIDDVVTTLDITVSVGSIPLSGWIKIDDEVMSFNRVSASQIIVQRSVFNTVSASHLNAASVTFTSVKETATPYREIQIETDYFITTGREG